MFLLLLRRYLYPGCCCVTAASDEGGDCGVLNTSPGQVTDGNLIIGCSARSISGNDLSKFGECRISRHNRSINGMMKFAKDTGLCLTVADIKVGLPNQGRVNFVFMFGIRAHRGDMGARFDPIGHQNRFACGRGGNNDVGIGRRILAITGGGNRNAKFKRCFFGTGFCLGQITCPDGGRGDIAHQCQGLELQSCLYASAVNRGVLGILAREILGRNTTGGGGADIGQVAVIKQDGF